MQSQVGARRFFVGMLLLVASVVHVGLTAVSDHVAGPFWLIIPVVAACLGVLCVASGGARSTQQ